MVNYKELGLVNTRDMFAKAVKGGYAIPAFNFNNLEQLQAIVGAAVETNSPVILQVSSGARKYANQTLLRYMAQGAVEYAKELGCPNPQIALHLDHGDSLELCKSCIEMGFSSVMIDGSHLPYDENVALTRSVVEYAHQYDVTVEGELGVLAGVDRVSNDLDVGLSVAHEVVGGAAGGLIGSKMDKQKRELEESMKNAKVESINDGQAIRVTFDSGILFATGSSNLNAASQRALTDFANNLMSNAQTNIQIVGHTDNTGSDRVNDPLSVNRAKSVQTFLASKGVSSARMSFSGMGSKAPIADNSTVAGRQENRRVEVYILPSQEMIEAAQNGTLR